MTTFVISNISESYIKAWDEGEILKTENLSMYLGKVVFFEIMTKCKWDLEKNCVVFLILQGCQKTSKAAAYSIHINTRTPAQLLDIEFY